jgi:RND family efflux transporter MFP subunit
LTVFFMKEATAMTHRKTFTRPLISLGIVLFTLAVQGCGGGHEGEKKGAAAAPKKVTGVVLETVSTTALPELLEVVGTVRASTSAVVSPRIPGTISALKVREGDRVRKGQLLAQLDAPENQANAAFAVSGITDAQRALDETHSRKILADTTFERYQKLYNEQVVSRQEFDGKKTEKDLAAQSVARAEARLNQSQEGSRAAAAISGYTHIRAPISGIVTSRQANLGATVFPSQPLMTIEDDGNYQLELAIPESMAGKLKPGAEVQVAIDGAGIPFAAKIAELVPAADPGSRTFIAKINLSQKGLKSGMFGRGMIALGNTVNGMRVLRKAIIERGAMTTVWVLDKNNMARMRLVKAGKTYGDRVEILAGLSDGERVVVGGLENVSEGTKVE